MATNKTITISEIELKEAIKRLVKWMAEECPNIEVTEIESKLLDELGPIWGREISDLVKAALNGEK